MMTSAKIGRRATLLGLSAAASVTGPMGAMRRGAAAEPLRLVTNWYAQAELGGFYSAQAGGLYEKQGLAITLQSGGPQINAMQLLIAGACDMIIGQSEAVLMAVQRGIPLVTIGACYPKCMTGLTAHPDVTDLSGLKDHEILISTEGRSTYWPWLRKTYGFKDSQAGVYTYNTQPFIHNPNLAFQSFVSSEPWALEQAKIPFHYFLFSDFGYPTYTNTLVVSRKTFTERRDVLARFLSASADGWLTYLYGDAGPGDVAIRRDNPGVTTEHLAWSREKLRSIHAMGKKGDRMFSMSDEQWAKIQEMVVASGAVAASANWKDAWSLELSDALTQVVPA